MHPFERRSIHVAHPRFSEIELRDDDSISLTIEVFVFEAGTPVEISGSATQANGAIATFYDIQNLPPADPDGGSLLTVIAAPPSQRRSSWQGR